MYSEAVRVYFPSFDPTCQKPHLGTIDCPVANTANHFYFRDLLIMTASPPFAPRWFILHWGFVLLLAGCAPVGPDYQPPQSSLPTQWQNGQPDTPQAKVQTLEQWWQLFEDPQLDTLIHEAIRANPDLGIAATRVREARAMGRIADADLWPSLNSGSAYSHSRKSDNIPSGSTRQDLFSLHFDADWEIDLFGGNRRQSEAAAASLAATMEAYRDVVVTLTAEVARHYVDLRAAQKRLRIAQQNIDLQARTLNLTRDKFATGLGNALEVAQAQTQLALLRSQLPFQESAADTARHQLALLLGKQPQPPSWLGAAPLPQPPLRLPAVFPSQLVRQRPDIRSAERLLAQANAEVGVATADLFPRFSLSALIGLQSTDVQQLITSGSRYWSLGPAIQWSLFDGGKRRAILTASEFRLDRARLTYEKTVLQALVDVENALVNFDREQETRTQLLEAVSSSRRAVELSQHQYRAGLNTFLNVLLTETTLAQAEDTLIQSDQRLALCMIVLFKAMGGGWHHGSSPFPVEAPHSTSTKTAPQRP